MFPYRDRDKSSFLTHLNVFPKPTAYLILDLILIDLSGRYSSDILEVRYLWAMVFWFIGQ